MQQFYLLQAPKEEPVVVPKDAKVTNQRGEPDGQPETFLRQKEAQLREKRERERQQKEQERHQPSQEQEKIKPEKDKSKEKDKDKEKDSKLLKSIENKPKKKDTFSQQKTESVVTSSKKTPPKSTLKGSTLRTSSKNVSQQIPQFHYPMGQPNTTDENDQMLQRVKEAFSKVDGGKVTKAHMSSITKVRVHSSFCKIYILTPSQDIYTWGPRWFTGGRP